ncbi:TonB-dependent receptor [candidate division WOR-3 bacterium]|nr:TonB-dependent receptor [candidate division WOR-3 bacterium]
MLLIILSVMYFESKGITVTADRFEHLPYQVEVIEIEDMLTIDELGEILEKEAGVKIYGNGDPSSLTQAAVHGYTAKHTLVMLNGHRISDPKTGGLDLSTFPLSAVKKIEIVKGSSSVFQGSNAIGGIINLVTGKETNDIKFQGNTNSALGANLQLYKFGVNGNLNLKKGEGQRSNTDFKHYSLAFNWNDLNFTGSYKDLGVPGALPDSGLIPIFGDSSATSLFDNQQTQFADLSYSKIFTNGDIGILIEPAITGELIKYNYKYSDFLTGDEITQNDEYKSAAGQFNTKLLYKMFTISMNLEKDKVWIEQYNPGYNNSFSFEEEKAGIVLSLFHKKEKINVFASAREDWYGSFGLHPSFTIGSRITSPIEIFASVGSGFQAPTLYDLYYPDFSNAELKPEHSISLNGGFKIKYITISGYIEEIHDRIALDENWLPQNIAKSRIFGIDIEADGEYKDLSYSLIYSYLDGYDEENRTKRELQHQPKHSIAGILSYEGPISVEVSGKWTGERKRWFSFGGWKIENPAFIIDLGISKTFNDFSVGFTVENLLNTEYIASFGSSYTDRDYPGMGRYISFWGKYSL